MAFKISHILYINRHGNQVPFKSLQSQFEDKTNNELSIEVMPKLTLPLAIALCAVALAWTASGEQVAENADESAREPLLGPLSKSKLTKKMVLEILHNT